MVYSVFLVILISGRRRGAVIVFVSSQEVLRWFGSATSVWSLHDVCINL